MIWTLMELKTAHIIGTQHHILILIDVDGISTNSVRLGQGLRAVILWQANLPTGIISINKLSFARDSRWQRFKRNQNLNLENYTK